MRKDHVFKFLDNKADFWRTDQPVFWSMTFLPLSRNDCTLQKFQSHRKKSLNFVFKTNPYNSETEYNSVITYVDSVLCTMQYTYIPNVYFVILDISSVLMFIHCRHKSTVPTPLTSILQIPYYKAKNYLFFCFIKYSTYEKIWQLKVKDHNEIHILSYNNSFGNKLN